MKFDSRAIESALDDELMTYSDLPLTVGNPSMERRVRVLALWDALSERNARRAERRLAGAFKAAAAKGVAR